MPKEKQKQPEFVRVGECLYRYQSSGTYYGLVKRKGRQIRKSLKTTDRKLAERRLKDFREAAERLGERKETRCLTFEELTELWAPSAVADLKPGGKERLERCLSMLNRRLGSHQVSGLTPADCRNWANQRGPGLAASTFNQELQALKRVLEHAVEEGIVLDNPAKGLKRKKGAAKPILIPSREEFQRLAEALANGDARCREALRLVKLLALSGMRLTEATQITWGEIDFARNAFLVTGGSKGTKNRLARHVPIFPSLKELLLGWKEDEAAKKKQRLVRIDSAKNAVATACQKAGLPRFTHHCLRHYFVSNAIEKGVDFKTIAAWIGHKDGGLLVAKTYGHLRDVHSCEMAKRMT